MANQSPNPFSTPTYRKKRTAKIKALFFHGIAEPVFPAASFFAEGSTTDEGIAAIPTTIEVRTLLMPRERKEPDGPCSGGHQKRAGHRARAPAEVQHIQRCASPARIDVRHQQIRRRNRQPQTSSVRPNAEDPNHLGPVSSSPRPPPSTGVRLDRETKSPARNQHARKGDSQGRSHELDGETGPACA